MADEITISSAADLFASEVLAAEFQLLISDRDPSILNHPALTKFTAPAGSTNIKVPLSGLNGSKMLAAHTAGTTIANTAMTDGKIDIALVNRVLAYELDVVAAYAAQGIVGAAAFAADLVTTQAQTLIELIAAAGSSFTNVAGVTETVLTWDTITTAKGKVAAEGATGPMCAIISPSQWTQLEKDGDNMNFGAAMSNMGVVNTRLGSYKGNYYGVDFYSSTRVPLANADADRAGSLFAPGALAWSDAALPDFGDSNTVSFGNARLQRHPQPNRQSIQYIYSYMCGVSVGQQAAGCKLLSVK